MARGFDYTCGSAWVLFLLVVINGSEILAITDIGVTDFRGKNTSLSEELYLQWPIKPKDATLDFIKCYHGYETIPKNYFYTYDFIGDRMHHQTELGNRTTHMFWYEGETAVFQLNISQPSGSDAGVYTCVLHAAGLPPARTARLFVKRVHSTTTVASMTSSSGYESSDPDYGAANKSSGGDNSTSQGIILPLSVISVILFLMLAIVIPTSIYFCRKNGSGNSLESSAESLNKEPAGEDSETRLTYSVNSYLCHRSEDSAIPSQDVSDTST